MESVAPILKPYKPKPKTSPRLTKCLGPVEPEHFFLTPDRRPYGICAACLQRHEHVGKIANEVVFHGDRK